MAAARRASSSRRDCCCAFFGGMLSGSAKMQILVPFRRKFHDSFHGDKVSNTATKNCFGTVVPESTKMSLGTVEWPRNALFESTEALQAM